LYQVNVTMSSSNIEKFHKLRDELWCRVRDNCLLGKYSFPDVSVSSSAPGEKVETFGQQLVSELATVRYSFNAHGGIVVESKKDLKSRGIASPNIADALCITEYFSNQSTRVFSSERPEYCHTTARYRNYQTSEASWMGM
jgi:phage terminase large subunit